MSDQGHSPFVWSTLGGIAHATERIRVGTGVTCPLIRIHPAIARAGGRDRGRDEEPPEIYVAAAKPQAARPDEEIVGTFADAGGAGDRDDPRRLRPGRAGGPIHVYVHQIGDNHDEFAEFAARELMPRF